MIELEMHGVAPVMNPRQAQCTPMESEVWGFLQNTYAQRYSHLQMTVPLLLMRTFISPRLLVGAGVVC
jgi:hypothetical protein